MPVQGDADLSGFAKLSEILFVGLPKLATGLGTIAFNLILLRVLGAEQFGVVSLCITTVVLVDSIIGAGIDLSVMKLAPARRETDPGGAAAIQRSAMYLKAIGGAMVMLPLSLAAGWWSMALFRSQGYEDVLLMSALATLALLMLRSTQVQLQIESRFRLYGAVELAHAALRFGGVAALIAAGRATPLSVMSCVAGAPLALLMVWLAAGARGLLSPPGWDGKATRQLLGHLRWSVVTFGLGALISRMDLFLLARWGSLAEVGVYSAALTIALMAQLAGTYIAVVTSPRVGPLLERGTFKRFYLRFQLGLLALAATGYLGFSLFWTLGGGLLFPARYAAAGPLIYILLPGTLAGLVSFPLTITYLMFVRPSFLFRLDCLTFPVLLALYWYLVPRFGATGAACVTTGVNVLRAIIAQWAAWQTMGHDGGSKVRAESLTAVRASV